MRGGRREKEKDSKDSPLSSLCYVTRRTQYAKGCHTASASLLIACAVVRVPSAAPFASIIYFFLVLSSFLLFLSDLTGGRDGGHMKTIHRGHTYPHEGARKQERRSGTQLCWPGQARPASFAHKSQQDGEDPTRTMKEWRYAGGGKQMRGTRG